MPPTIPKFNSIFAGLRTKDERDELLRIIAELKKSSFQSHAIDIEKIIKDTPFEKFATELKELSSDSAKLMSLSETLSALSILELDIVFQPTQEAVIKISEWIKKNVGTNVLVDFQHDQELIGGARIIFQGRSREFALLDAIDTLFKEKSEKVLKELKA